MGQVCAFDVLVLWFGHQYHRVFYALLGRLSDCYCLDWHEHHRCTFLFVLHWNISHIHSGLLPYPSRCSYLRRCWWHACYIVVRLVCILQIGVISSNKSVIVHTPLSSSPSSSSSCSPSTPPLTRLVAFQRCTLSSSRLQKKHPLLVTLTEVILPCVARTV